MPDWQQEEANIGRGVEAGNNLTVVLKGERAFIFDKS